jgi:Flp pilus assembly protein CpaB
VVGAALLDRGNGRNGTDATAVAPERRIDRRRPLPGGRAVVGGLLVTLAAVGVFMAWSARAGDVTRPVVVAAADLRPGEVLGPDDLEVRALDLPAELSDRAYADPRALLGAVALGPLAEGELVQRSAVVEPGASIDGTVPAAELSFAVDADRALDGRLQVGERVDVLATFGTGVEAETDVIVRDAVVLAGTREEGGIGARRLTLTLGLRDDDDVVALTHAVRAGEVTVVRTVDDAATG